MGDMQPNKLNEDDIDLNDWIDWLLFCTDNIVGSKTIRKNEFFFTKMWALCYYLIIELNLTHKLTRIRLFRGIAATLQRHHFKIGLDFIMLVFASLLYFSFIQ